MTGATTAMAATGGQSGGHGEAVVLLGQDGRLWAALADYLLLEVRRALGGRRGRLRVAVPALGDAPLYPRATHRFALAVGAREHGALTLPILLERYLGLGEQVDLLTTIATGAAGRQTEAALARLTGRSPRCSARIATELDAVLAVAPSFALLASGARQGWAGGGDAGVLALGPALRRGIADGFDGLWRGAVPWGEATDAR